MTTHPGLLARELDLQVTTRTLSAAGGTGIVTTQTGRSAREHDVRLSRYLTQQHRDNDQYLTPPPRSSYNYPPPPVLSPRTTPQDLPLPTDRPHTVVTTSSPSI